MKWRREWNFARSTLKPRKFDRTENEDDRFRGGTTAATDAERKGLSARCTTSIYPVLNTYQDRRRHRSSRFSILPLSPLPPHRPLLDGDDTRVSEIMKFRRCRSNARDDDRAIYRSLLISAATRFPSLPHRRPPFSFFRFFPSFFPFFGSLSFLAARYTCRTPSNVRASAEYTLVWCHFWEILTRASIEPVATMHGDVG